MNNNFEVICGSIMNHVTGCLLQEPAMIMMNSIGAPLKFGEYNQLKEYFDTFTSEMNQKGMKEFAEDYDLIKFNVAHPELGFEPEGYNFTAEEICTLFNWLQNCSIGGEKWKQFKSLSIDDMKEQLRHTRNVLCR